jgi:hypothetical protein
VQAAKPCARFEVTTHASGFISHADSALLVELADRVPFTSTLDRYSPPASGPLVLAAGLRPPLAGARVS